MAENQNLNELNMFVQTLRKLFNHDLALDNNFEQQIFDYFNFYWKNKHNYFLLSD